MAVLHPPRLRHAPSDRESVPLATRNLIGCYVCDGRRYWVDKGERNNGDKVIAWGVCPVCEGTGKIDLDGNPARSTADIIKCARRMARAVDKYDIDQLIAVWAVLRTRKTAGAIAALETLTAAVDRKMWPIAWADAI